MILLQILRPLRIPGTKKTLPSGSVVEGAEREHHPRVPGPHYVIRFDGIQGKLRSYTSSILIRKNSKNINVLNADEIKLYEMLEK